MSSEQAVRPAVGEDVPRAVRTLTRAFSDYAWTRHTLAADDHSGRLARFHELFLSHIGLEHGRVWVNDEVSAVAVWTTPRTPAEVFADLGPRFAEIAGARAEAFAEADAACRPHRPQEPVWFLGAVGVDPARQGGGRGAAVVRPGIDAAAREGVPAFLETSSERNVRFYQRLGFEVTAEYDIPGGGFRNWSMLRPAGAAEA